MPGMQCTCGSTRNQAEAGRGNTPQIPMFQPAPFHKPRDGRPNGCHNREPFKGCFRAQDGWNTDGTAKWLMVPFRMSLDCEYSKSDLGQIDKRCNGCKWRANDL